MVNHVCVVGGTFLLGAYVLEGGLGAHVCRMLIGAYNPTLCPNHGVRSIELPVHHDTGKIKGYA